MDSPFSVIFSIETIAAGNHNVEQKERGRLAFRILNDAADAAVEPYLEAGRFKVMPHQPGDVRVIFQHENGLIQSFNPLAGRNEAVPATSLPYGLVPLCKNLVNVSNLDDGSVS